MFTTDRQTTHTSRRSFLKGATLGVGVPLVGGLLAACGTGATQAPAEQATMQHEAAPPTQTGTPTVDEMDAMHEAGIKAFVAGVKT